MRIYKVNIFYIKFLQSLDSRVMWPKEYHFTRPYVGVLLDIDSCKFFGPLSSNNRNKQNWAIVDLKLVAGSIFLANMIPIPNLFINEIVSEVDVDKYFFNEDREYVSYGLKLFGQSEVLKQKLIQDELVKKSARIYKMQPHNTFYNKICCNFKYLKIETLNWKISFWYLLYLINEYAKLYNIHVDLTSYIKNDIKLINK